MKIPVLLGVLPILLGITIIHSAFKLIDQGENQWISVLMGFGIIAAVVAMIVFGKTVVFALAGVMLILIVLSIARMYRQQTP